MSNGTRQEAEHKRLAKQNIQSCSVQVHRTCNQTTSDIAYTVTLSLGYRGLYANCSQVKILVAEFATTESAEAEAQRLATYYGKLLKE